MAGAGGNWKVIGERPGGAVGQQTSTSCGAACGQMLSGISQSQLIATAGAPTSVGALASALGPGWIGGYAGPGQFQKLMGLGRPWAAHLRDGGRLGHFVVVNGRAGRNLVIHDPARGGTTYQMTPAEFDRVWNGEAVFR